MIRNKIVQIAGVAISVIYTYKTVKLLRVIFGPTHRNLRDGP